MITASDSYALCEYVEDHTYRVVRKGSKRKMWSAFRAAKRDDPGKKHCVYLTLRSKIGDLIS